MGQCCSNDPGLPQAKRAPHRAARSGSGSGGSPACEKAQPASIRDVASQILTPALSDSSVSNSSDAATPRAAAVRRDFAPGEVLCQGVSILDVRRYRIMGEVGRGQYGTVYKANHRGASANSAKQTGTRSRYLAVKVIAGASIAHIGPEKIVAEAAMMSRFQHPNVMSLDRLELDIHTQSVWMCMEFVEGCDLQRVVKHSVTGIPEAVAADYFRQIAEGLRYIHSRGVVHRDLKCDNIMIDSSGVAKITDFGLSCVQTTDSQGEVTGEHLLKARCGTPNYVAPDVVFPVGGGYSGFKSDVWSLGVVLYVMLTGSLPFSGPDLPTVLHALRKGAYATPASFSPEASDVVAAMLDTNAATRATLPELLVHPFVSQLGDCESEDEFAISMESDTGDEISASFEYMAPAREIISAWIARSKEFVGGPGDSMRTHDQTSSRHTHGSSAATPRTTSASLRKTSSRSTRRSGHTA